MCIRDRIRSSGAGSSSGGDEEARAAACFSAPSPAEAKATEWIDVGERGIEEAIPDDPPMSPTSPGEVAYFDDLECVPLMMLSNTVAHVRGCIADECRSRVSAISDQNYTLDGYPFTYEGECYAAGEAAPVTLSPSLCHYQASELKKCYIAWTRGHGFVPTSRWVEMCEEVCRLAGDPSGGRKGAARRRDPCLL